MKKLLSILLFGFFILHHVGYYFIFKAIKHQNDLTWQVKVIHNDFEQTRLQKISIPITFPYQHDQKEYEYVNESLELDGNFYRIVKKRYAQDTLHIVYINDYESKKIHNDFKKWTNQLGQNDKNSQSQDTQAFLRLLHSQYIPADYIFQPLSISIGHLTHKGHYFHSFSQVFLSIPIPPPKSDFFS